MRSRRFSIFNSYWDIPGNMAGVHVDENDHIWILQRGNTVQLDLGDDYLELGSAECCTPAPSVVEFDQEGNILQAWGRTG